MADNGSTGNAVGNNIYPDLILTRYPELFDERSGSKYNPNLKRWTNLKDYNMAEHVNSLQDAIMSMQRMLGEMAQMPAEPKDVNGQPVTDQNQLTSIAQSNTVKARLDAIETKDWYSIFDKRYGGPVWSFTDGAEINPTIQQHRHLGSASGVAGMPEKIVLTEEVQGQLPKSNVDLSKTNSGITGSDIYVEKSSPQKISAAINDKISETTGGTIQENATLTIKGKTNTRWTREFDISDASMSENTLVADNNTLLRQAVQTGDLENSNLISKDIEGMYFGRYVAIARLSCSSLTSENVAVIEAYKDDWVNIGRITLKGSDFDNADEYKNFFLIFEHKGVTRFRIRKVTTSSAARIRFDYAIIEPVHPAVFDR